MEHYFGQNTQVCGMHLPYLASLTTLQRQRRALLKEPVRTPQSTPLSRSNCSFTPPSDTECVPVAAVTAASCGRGSDAMAESIGRSVPELHGLILAATAASIPTRLLMTLAC